MSTCPAQLLYGFGLSFALLACLAASCTVILLYNLGCLVVCFVDGVAYVLVVLRRIGVQACVVWGQGFETFRLDSCSWSGFLFPKSGFI